MSSEVSSSIENAWERLEAQLDFSAGFWFGFVFSAAPQAVNTLWGKTNSILQERGQVRLHRDIKEPTELSQVLRWLLTSEEARKSDCVWIESIRADALGASEQPWTDAWNQLFSRANEHRDALRARLQGGLVFAAPPFVLPLLREAAPDLWSTRSLVIVVDVMPVPVKPEPARKTVETVTPRRGKTMRSDYDSPVRAPRPAPPAASRFLFSEAERLDIEDLITQGHLDEAQTRLGRVLNEGNKLEKAFAYRLTALLHQVRGANDLAIRAFHRALGNYQEASPGLVPIDWYEAAAQISIQIGEMSGARDFLTAALAQCRKHVRTKETIDTLRELVVVLQAMGDFERQAGQLAAAETALDEAVIVSRRLVDLRDDAPEHLMSLSTSLLGLGDIRGDKGDFAGAMAAFEELRKLGQKICNVENDSRASLRSLSVALTRLGGLKQDVGDFEGAKAALYEALSLRRGIARMAEEDPQSLRDLASVLSRIGALELSLKDFSAAAWAIEESVSLDRKFGALIGRSADSLHDLAVSLFRLGEVRQKQGDVQAAAVALEESIKISHELAARDSFSKAAQTTLDAAEKALAFLRREP